MDNNNHTNAYVRKRTSAPKEKFDNNSEKDLDMEDKPYTVVKGKNRGRMRILNKLLLFFALIFFVLIVLYLYKVMPYK